LYTRYLAARYRSTGIPTVINGCSVRVAPGTILPDTWDPASGQITYEPETWNLLVGETREGDIVADVGANVGIYTLGCAGRGARVWAFEPDPRTCELLRRNVDLNDAADRVTVREAAVGDTAGITRFAATGSPMSSSNAAWTVDGVLIDVATVTLGDVLTRVDLLKIDVEGMEEAVLAGARVLLVDPNRRPRCIVVEVHPTVADVGNVRALIEECGYEIEELGAAVGDERRKWIARPLSASASRAAEARLRFRSPG
jgi:FkbM family methyltransferase